MFGKKAKAEQPLDLPELYSGMRAEILTLTNRLIFVGKLELQKGAVLQITEESGENVPWVEDNEEIKIRGFQQDGTPFALRGYICGSSDKIWKVDRLKSLQKEELRMFYRQIVNIPASVVCVNHIFTQDAGKQRPSSILPCMILDISGGGVKLRCNATPPFELNDWLYVSLDDPMQEDSELNYTCCVRRVTPGDNSYEYGCEFDALTESEQEHLLRVVMTMQQRELRARRRREEY